MYSKCLNWTTAISCSEADVTTFLFLGRAGEPNRHHHCWEGDIPGMASSLVGGVYLALPLAQDPSPPGPRPHPGSKGVQGPSFRRLPAKEHSLTAAVVAIATRVLRISAGHCLSCSIF